ncbi:hypothetical protein VCR5J5_190068 [Vibrio crassostreae]|uniref:Uncharacterized protein n=1 Tax=Vibrio crassostreae TaxID=246167 RepID=A0A822MXK0_9VIBR|nr:hypothetical protein VCR5J5_190068 [Vibrio crassostreae]
MLTGELAHDKQQQWLKVLFCELPPINKTERPLYRKTNNEKNYIVSIDFRFSSVPNGVSNGSKYRSKFNAVSTDRRAASWAS